MAEDVMADDAMDDGPRESEEVPPRAVADMAEGDGVAEEAEQMPEGEAVEQERAAELDPETFKGRSEEKVPDRSQGGGREFANDEFLGKGEPAQDGADDGSGSEDDPCCRICRQGEEVGKLYCPCRCAGSIKWIHESCLQVWLQAQDRRPVCELCGHQFEYLRVYSEHAPHRLTVADWLGALCSSAHLAGKRLLRIVYATVVWGVALPLLTVNSAHTLYGRGRGLSPTDVRHVLPFTLNVFLGQCLSLAGIAVIYLNSIVPGLLAAVPQSVTATPAVSTVAAGPAQPLAQEAAHGTDSTLSAAEPVPRPLPPLGPAAVAPPVLALPPSPPPGRAPTPVTQSRRPAAAEDDELPDPEEDLWNIMGLQGNPLRALGCMVTFLGANVIGVGLFLAIPCYIGRMALRRLFPLVVSRPSGGDNTAALMEWMVRFAGAELSTAGPNAAVNDSAAGPPLGSAAAAPAPQAWLSGAYLRSHGLPPPGHSLLLDMGALTMGYASLTVVLIALIPSGLLLGAALGCSTRGPEVVRAFTTMAAVQACQAAAQAWLKLQMLAMLLLQLVLVPCYIGHLVVCLLCGPVLHLPQETRAAMANANLPLTLVMQLFIGYVHLWGIAFLEGCVADIFVPAVLRNASSNFFIGALCSHRRLFGTGTAPSGSAEWPLLLPVSHLTALKLALVHVAFHTPLAFVLWHLPAWMLDRMLGETLFPVHLVDHAAGAELGAQGARPWEGTESDAVTRPSGNGRGVMPGQPGDGQPFFAIEMLQLYILVLQCLRVLDASPGLARLVVAGLRNTFQSLGLQHLLANVAAPVSSPPPASARIEANVAAPATSPLPVSGRIEAALHMPSRRLRPLLVLSQSLVVASLLVVLSWTGMLLMLSLPLSVGRMLVRYILAAQAKRVSDFLPLSLGVVVFSAVILAVVKLSEALPAITARASMLEHRRCIHMLFCTASSTAMAVATLVLIPLGLGTLLLRLVLPLKAHSVYQVPIVFLVTDCWSLGLVLTKVVWRMVQTDVMLHSLHLEFVAAWADVQGSLTNLFFDLRAHCRIWRSLLVPLLEAITVHLLFPQTAALTLLRYCIREDQEFVRSALLMYCYHAVLGVRLWFTILPVAQQWITGVRQRIFDAKYLVSTELQNYHSLDANQASGQVAAGA